MAHDLFIVPGYHGSGAAHWQSWLQNQQPGTSRLAGVDWEQPQIEIWAEQIVATLATKKHRSLIVAHSFGVLASAVAVAKRPDLVAGVIFVAPADPDRFSRLGARQQLGFAHPSISQLLPQTSLQVPGWLIGSRNDPWMRFSHAADWSRRWQLGFLDAGDAGHINIDSGFGPWPFIQTLATSSGAFDSVLSSATDHASWQQCLRAKHRRAHSALLMSA